MLTAMFFPPCRTVSRLDIGMVYLAQRDLFVRCHEVGDSRIGHEKCEVERQSTPSPNAALLIPSYREYRPLHTMIPLPAVDFLLRVVVVLFHCSNLTDAEGLARFPSFPMIDRSTSYSLQLSHILIVVHVLVFQFHVFPALLSML